MSTPPEQDVVPDAVWVDADAALHQRVRHPDKTAPFRGSLVDPRMFAIDAEEWGERNLYEEYCASHPCLLRIENPTGSEE